MSLYDGGYLGYTSIIESDPPDFVNGGIQHEYAMFPFFSVEQLCGIDILNLPTGTTSTYSGNETTTRFFDKDLSIRREVLNYYEYYPQDIPQEYRAVATSF